MTETDLIVQLHRRHHRQGPGSDKETLRAWEMMPLAERFMEVADIGCGTGGQTLILAEKIHGHITAIDIFPEFLETLKQRAESAGLKDKITPLEKSMDELPFEKESLNLIWSEGAIYNIGFENGIKNWKRFLKPGGFLAVSEVIWTTPHRPEFLENYWMAEYPEISTAASKIKILEDHHFTLEGYFNLGSDSWLDQYYLPLEESFTSFLEDNNHSEQARKVIQDYSQEMDFYKKYKEYYTYGFFIARKNE